MYEPLLSPSVFEEEFRAFARQEEAHPSAPGALVFYGSSSIRFWLTLAKDFPETRVINRGFGGSTLAECVRELERLVVPLQPRAMVLYAGENDIDQGATPEQLLATFETFLRELETHLGPLPVVVLSLKPSPARFSQIDRIRRANALLRAAVEQRPHVHFLDVFERMLETPERVRHELFTADCLHMSRAGYVLWRDALRPFLSARGLLE
jgi:lysophospholipase L1-like esterase